MACLVLAVALTSCGDDAVFDEQWAAQQRIEELEAELERAQAELEQAMELVTATTTTSTPTATTVSTTTTQAPKPSQPLAPMPEAPTAAWDDDPIAPPASLADMASAWEDNPVPGLDCRLLAPTELWPGIDAYDVNWVNPGRLGGRLSSIEVEGLQAYIHYWPLDNGNVLRFFKPDVWSREYKGGGVHRRVGNDVLLAIPGEDCFYEISGVSYDGNWSNFHQDWFWGTLRRIGSSQEQQASEALAPVPQLPFASWDEPPVPPPAFLAEVASRWGDLGTTWCSMLAPIGPTGSQSEESWQVEFFGIFRTGNADFRISGSGAEFWISIWGLDEAEVLEFFEPGVDEQRYAGGSIQRFAEGWERRLLAIPGEECFYEIWLADWNMAALGNFFDSLHRIDTGS